MSGTRRAKRVVLRRQDGQTQECPVVQLPLVPLEWTVPAVDERTGGRLGQAEFVYRRQIASEGSQDGGFAVDNRYLRARDDIHQPLLGEQGHLSQAKWELQRARTTLLVSIPDLDDPQAVREAAVQIAKAALGPFAGELMLQLYAIANDPPNWRNPAFSISLSDLLDRMGYTRDNRGRHYMTARRQISSALLALHFTHVGLRHEANSGRQQGVVAPLLDTLAYDAGAEASQLGVLEVFAQGLPDRVAVRIHQLWFDGLRTQDGLPGVDYTLIPRQAPRRGGRGRGGSRSSYEVVLREYLQRCQQDLQGMPLVLTRERLLMIAGIHSVRAYSANQTLARCLEHLREQGLVESFGPTPLPTQPDARVIIRWPMPVVGIGGALPALGEGEGRHALASS